MSAFYNENDPKAAAWLRELIKEGHIAHGIVDERSIADLKAHELEPFTQCHFFAGIGGWSYTLRLAGVPDDTAVWTGSCPCQPFSVAGKGLGTADSRHLWPTWFKLIKACSPSLIFGEQVASTEIVGSELEAAFVDAVQGGDFAAANKLAKRLVRQSSFSYDARWIDGVRADLEAAHFTFGACDTPAAGVGAPHIRQRLFWMAHASGARSIGARRGPSGEGRAEFGPAERGEIGGLAIAHGGDASAERKQRGGEQRFEPEDGGVSGLADPASKSGAQQRNEPREGSRRGASPRDSAERAGPRWVGDANGSGLIELRGPVPVPQKLTSVELRGNVGSWSNFDIIPCTDGKARRVESGTFPLAHGVPHRVGLLRGYGNAIVPQVAAEFISAALEAISLA